MCDCKEGSQPKMRSILRQMFLNSVNHVRSNALVSAALKIKNEQLVVGDKTYPLTKNYYCVGFGKAVLGMACQVEELLQENLVQGILSMPIGTRKLNKHKDGLYLKDNSKFSVFEGAVNNLPDQRALEAANSISKLVTDLREDDVLLVLISGGGSALLPLPINPISLDEKIETIKLLSSKGATITELNGVRQNLSQLKGGKLATLAYPAQVISLILSDIVNDPIHFIASGPTAAPQCLPKDAIDILKKYSVYDHIPESVSATLCKSVEEPIDLSHVQNLIIGNNEVALEGIAGFGGSYFSLSYILSNSVQGLVDNVAEFYTELVKLMCRSYLGIVVEEELEVLLNELLNKYDIVFYHNKSIADKLKLFNVIQRRVNRQKQKIPRTLCFVMGGEPTVQVKGNGIGGRNQELALNLGLRLSELAATNEWMKPFKVWFLSGGTDGIDGPTDAAGAMTHSSQMREAADQGLDAQKYLMNNDSFTFFSKLNNGADLIKTGHTGTNVMDIHILVIEVDPFKLGAI
nr:PREDICTED: glycerate kinase isoform X1 [Bemisia tabaci]